MDKDRAIAPSLPTVLTSKAAAATVVPAVAADTPQPGLTERLAELKQQLKAVAALVVNDAGQVLEEAGSAVDISTGSALLSALMHTFRASLQVIAGYGEGLIARAFSTLPLHASVSM